MEAKVDIRKLQLLSDRISQTIDALNQVRLTVHGLSHSSPYAQMNPFMATGFTAPQVGAIGQQGIVPSFGVGVNPYLQATQGIGGFGLQHSSPYTAFSPYTAINPYAAINPLALQGIAGVQNPFIQSQLLGGGLGFGGIGVGGLLHSSPDVIENQLLLQRANDPSRIAATFPFALQPQSPVAGLF